MSVSSVSTTTTPPPITPNTHSRWVGHGVLLFITALLAVFAWLAPTLGLDYYVDFVRRILIVSMAALSLNFLIGRAGLAALGHAGFVGVGAYAVVAMMESGFSNAWIIWLVAAVAGSVIAGLIGLVAVRTKGVYFIMITLAFAQMLYYVAVSLRAYGGDDGYTMYSPLVLFETAAGSINAEGNWLFAIVLIALFTVFLAQSRMERSYFGRALEGIRDNETRMQAMGYPTFRLKLLAFALAGGVASLAGAMLATQNLFVSPSLMHWSQSALLIVMVVIGGIGLKWGAPLGVAVWLTLEEVLKLHTEYWHAPMGLLLVAVVFLAPRGLSALFHKKEAAA
ncbi:branched-chain amino acid ABC transporter permease [Comamonas sp. NoAH]|uniref:branched-chain amino acid ABC transporter permease n=1 Tax=Comamonas halotolerans TaxID=3041496 RepID=UPI0024E0A551|nr:branched-chain amino acid ABC transporter permease [Comamonas sp. NoAH]